MHYVAVIDKDDNSTYGVRFPDVPGCFSAADTLDEIVPARGIETVLREVAEGLAAGAVLMMIPHISDHRRVVRVNLSLAKGLLDTSDEAARARGMTRSAFIATAVTREICDPG